MSLSLYTIKNFFNSIAKHIATDWFGVDYLYKNEHSESDSHDSSTDSSDVDNHSDNVTNKEIVSEKDHTVIDMEPLEEEIGHLNVR